MVREHRARRSATLGLLLALTMLLAACGQTATPTNGASAALNAAGTPTAPGTSSTPLTTPATPTAVPPPYSFPKKWIAAPDSADLPQSPSTVGSFVFSPTAPSTGYLCVASPDSSYDSPTTPPFISTTTDGGKTWRQASGSTSRSKSICQMFIDQSNPRDIFVAAGHYGSTDTAPLPLFRSQDGGATWKSMPQPTISGNPTYIIGLAVVQSRILAMISPLAQAGPAVGTLYASDDGGQSWKPISLVLNGHTQQLGASMWVVGTAVYIVVGQGCQGCGALWTLTNDPPGVRPLDQPFSSGGPTSGLNPIYRTTGQGNSATDKEQAASNSTGGR
jgi:BNR/Asp-box repeat